MDSTDAQRALAAADAAAASVRGKGSLPAAGLALLGIAETVLILLFGAPLILHAGSAGMILVIAPLIILTVVSASRSVVPRHHRSLYAILTGFGAAITVVTVTFGRGFFPESWAWWIVGAVLSGVPFYIAAWIEHSRRVRPAGAAPAPARRTGP